MALLFMGLVLDAILEEKLMHPAAQQFIEKDRLLITVSFHNKNYLGKDIVPSSSIEELFDLQKHIISLILRLAPQYPIKPEDVKIFAYDREQYNSC